MEIPNDFLGKLTWSTGPVTSDAARTGSRSRAGFTPFDFALYATTVFAWSVSWYALTLQLGVVAPEVSLVYRFAIAVALMFGWALATSRKLAFGPREHGLFALMGVCLFSTNFILFYYGGNYLVSGLLSVVFSLASAINMLLAIILRGERASVKDVVAVGFGFGGTAMVFWPQLQQTDFGGATLIGIGLCVMGTLSFCLGNQVSARLQAQTPRIPIVSMNAWGMLYGALWSAMVAVTRGQPFSFDPSLSYVGSLVFLAIVSTVIAFASYLTLLGRIGPGRAAYATVIFPIFALLISTVLESYQWTPIALAGLVFVVIGNVLIVRASR